MAFNFLLVDDSSIVRKSIKKIFALTELEIASVYEAADGKEGIEQLRNNWVDLVFLDINMPVMNGIEFMEAIKVDEELSDTKVIVVSTEGSAERRQQLSDLGVVDYMRKPFTPEELIEKVNAILQGASENG